jgi:hypothetical protein
LPDSGDVAHDAETQLAPKHIWQDLVAVCATAVQRRAVPRPAPRGAINAGRRASRIDQLRVRIFAHPILAPLPNISRHVVKTKLIRLEFPDARGKRVSVRRADRIPVGKLYPFSDTMIFRLSMDKPVRFPLYLRVPRWSGSPVLEINGKREPLHAEPLSYIRIERTWSDDDVVTFRMPMSVTVRVWKKNKDAVSVNLGPLTFALKIDERWQKSGGTEVWPEWEVFPASAWNYGLVLDPKSPAESFQIVRKPGPLTAQPFTAKTTPIELRAKARRIPAWTVDRTGLVGPLQQSPARSAQPEEQITLIPMGAARLRISAFPTTSDRSEAHKWIKSPMAAEGN